MSSEARFLRGVCGGIGTAEAQDTDTSRRIGFSAHRAGVGRGCFSFGGTVQYIEESNIYLCFVVCRLKRGLVT